MPELRVSAGIADRTMKLKVFVDTVTASTRSRIDRCQFATDGGDLRALGTLCGERGNFAFDHAAHFDNLNNSLNRLHDLGVEGERAVLMISNEDARTLS